MKSPIAVPFFRHTAALLFATALFLGGAHAQTLYVTTNGGGTIEQITSGGVASTLATGLTAPKGLAFGPNGNLYVAQDFSGTLTSLVSQVTVPGGVVSNFATSIQFPIGVAFNTGGDMFIASYSSPLGILKVASGGSTVTTFASGLNSPFGVAVNSSGVLFVANRDNGTVSQIATNGTVSLFASGFSQPNDLTFDSSGNLYVSNFSAGTVSKVTSGGSVSTFVSGLSSPVGLAFNPVSGALFVAQQGTNSIAQVALAGGSFTTFATGISGPQYLAFTPGSAIPEPSTYAALMGAGALGFVVWSRRRRSTSAALPVANAGA